MSFKLKAEITCESRKALDNTAWMLRGFQGCRGTADVMVDLSYDEERERWYLDETNGLPEGWRKKSHEYLIICDNCADEIERVKAEEKS